MLLRRGLITLGVAIALATGVTLVFGAKRIAAENAAYVSKSGRQCLPAHTNLSDLLPGTGVQVTPLPDSFDAPNTTQISFLGAPVSTLSHISVTGSYSHAHPGKLEAYSQGDGASFVPAKPFHPSETVTVRGNVQRGSRSVPFAYHFTVAVRDPIEASGQVAVAASKPDETLHFHSQPSMHAPSIDIDASSAGQEAGDIFVAPYSGPSPPGPMIFDNKGNLVWFDQLSGGLEATNVKVQAYEGHQVLTWWQGRIPPQGFGMGEEIVANSSYQTVMKVRAGNGMLADLHEFRLEPSNNTALLTVFDPIYCNISSVGGPSDGAVTDSFFQEIDLKTHLVRREWHPVDHVPLTHSVEPANGVTIQWPYDFFHLNSVQRRSDGSYLLSSRDTSAMYLIDGHSGQVVEQIGGPHGNTKQGPGASTAFQHDAEEQPGGLITVFDNGGSPFRHTQSRALVLQLNPKTRKETLVRQYEHNKPLTAGSQGNMQMLPNGNVLIGWGPEPYISEYTASGTLVWGAIMAGKTNSYRAYRFPWTGTPTGSPSVAAAAGASGTTDVYASWNGATTIASWRVLAGSSASALSPVGGGAFAGFETTIPIAGKPAYVAVQALDASGNVLGTSSAVAG
ncbi:MAG TPA: arylsulfotransferase family protein [Solirubrobacteraceae bacterium]|nr:arylsulfotransferase family protein [Solirubrobacteraceae bacterium]